MLRASLSCVLLLLLSQVYAPASESAALGPPPNAEERAGLLASAGQYAEKYVNSLPNFICLRVNQQFEGNKKGEKWHQGDTLTSRLEWRDGREKRTLQLVNDRPLNQVTRRWHTPLTTEGEFGSMLEGIFADSSNASFEWDRWDQIRNRRVAVFKYSIPQEHSVLKLGDTMSGTFAVPYHGFFAVEPGTGIVLQVNVSADEIPKQLQSREISTTIDYDQIAISGENYVLPVHATVVLHTDRNVIRNELGFEQYRKFGAESSLSFGGGEDSTPANSGQPQQPK